VSRKARLMFPYIVQCLPETRATLQFDQAAALVPSWMFIEWLPQLLAYIPTERGLSAVQLVRQVAEDYPGSLTYTWRVSQQDW